MAVAYIGLGSNLGNRRAHLLEAAAMIAERAGEVLSNSHIYESKPWGFVSQHDFLNMVLKLQTPSEPLDLLQQLQQIEQEMGRQTHEDGHYHDRPVDLDILLYDDRVIDSPTLHVPHPLMQERLFVMQPLAEIAPFVKHPVLHTNMQQIYQDLLKKEPDLQPLQALS